MRVAMIDGSAPTSDRSDLARSAAQVDQKDNLPTLRKGALTSSHIVRWCAAQENWDKIHYDDKFARDVGRLPGPIINGALKQHFIVQFLENGFGLDAWIWRIDYKFIGIDLVGQEVEVRGSVADSSVKGDLIFFVVDVAIWNRNLNQATTVGEAVVVVHRRRRRIRSADEFFSATDKFQLDESIAGSSGAVPPAVAASIGKVLEEGRSVVPVDLSRLRLFADAVMGLDTRYFDSNGGDVVAPPLFPLHGIKQAPGARPLSTDPGAFGREGVHEVGRNVAIQFGLDPTGMLNGGNKVQIHSLAKLGEYLAAESTLASAKERFGARGGRMLVVETLNRYREATTGRLLITERQTVIYRFSHEEESRG